MTIRFHYITHLVPLNHLLSPDKATNPHNSELDVATIDAFCCAVKNEPACAPTATKLLADRIQSANPNESLNALNVSDNKNHHNQ